MKSRKLITNVGYKETQCTFFYVRLMPRNAQKSRMIGYLLNNLQAFYKLNMRLYDFIVGVYT
jgi:hypothetical protein